ncbi:hypothetical protein PAXRUDRAFT_828155 [Paxillus rubicundulus Ve08.2h10]|uniref:Uncharacterized protein n=1 Tax=Paxillus rubicundulus Ve08.2h10 TaxID=930991 RepID=A0A0D0DWJ6_9AGAM|nr:hypothetical protein PAXRUDRAFT_828155 [Paxillus rubicundulus Ve08.2h10]
MPRRAARGGSAAVRLFTSPPETLDTIVARMCGWSLDRSPGDDGAKVQPGETIGHTNSEPDLDRSPSCGH